MTNLELFSTEQIRLDAFLRRELPSKINAECSNSKIRRLIVAGTVAVNGRQVMHPAFELRGRSTVSIQFDPEKFFYEKQPDDIHYEVTPQDVLFEDDNLIFLNKPAFFPVEQTITGNRDNLHDALVRFLWARNSSLRNPPYAGIMHRLDRETSGVILFTKTRTVNKDITELFQTHNFDKIYTCLVPAIQNKKYKTGNTFTVEKFMGRVSGKSQAGKWGSLPESKGGQYSKTEFTVGPECTVDGVACFQITCKLFTGRTHQIRVHLSEAGLPILGDTLYGGLEAKRMYLHASELCFEPGVLPGQAAKIVVKAPLPW